MKDKLTNLNNVLSLIRGHNIYMSNKVDLIASNSWTSNINRLALSSTLLNNYCIGLPGARLYGGCTYIDMIEREVYALLKKIFNMDHVVVQYLSGMQANIGAYHAILEPGDTILSALPKHGGHYSHTIQGPLRFFNPKIVPLPFDESIYNVDLNQLEDMIKKEKPKMIILGWSEFLFPHPLEKIRSICDQYNVRLMYDMSHVIGLIAGNTFQPEATRYADIVTSSTGKSLHSADHGIILFNDPSLRDGVLEAVMPLLTSNTHPQEVASLGIALSEMIEFGNDYAKQVIANSKALGKALYDEGINVLYPDLDFTESHTLMVEYKEALQAVSLLDRAGILTNGCPLPWNKEGEVTGLRIGTQVVTRHGMTEKDMPLIAKAIREVLIDGKLPEIVQQDLAHEFGDIVTKTAYSFDSELSVSSSWFEDIFKSYKAETVSAILRTSPAFANCEMHEIESIEDHFELKEYKEGEEVFQANTDPDAVFFIANGNIDVVDNKDGKKNVIISQGEGTHLGELGVLTGKKRMFAAVAKTPVLSLKISANEFKNILNRYASVEEYFQKYVISLQEMGK